MSGEGEHGQQGPSSPAVGPLAVEAALLLDVVADRLTALKPETSGAESAGPTTGSTGPEGADATHESTAGRPLGPDGRCPECGSVPGASCTACPLCRFLAILRGERPETTAKLVDGALLIVRALRTMIPDAPAPAGGSAGPGDPPPPPPARRGGFERIDIG